MKRGEQFFWEIFKRKKREKKACNYGKFDNDICKK